MRFLLCLLFLHFPWPTPMMSPMPSARKCAQLRPPKCTSATASTATNYCICLSRRNRLPAVIKAILPPVSRASVLGSSTARASSSRAVFRAGVKFWRAHEASLARAEALYGVPREIIVGIIGVETIYGKRSGHFQTYFAGG